MKLVHYQIDGKEYHLLLNGTALFDFYDRFGHNAELMGVLAVENEKESFQAAIWMLSEFSIQGELYRRSQGMDKGDYLRVEQAALIVTPADIPALKQALAETIQVGFQRNHASNEDCDPWLLELTQKKTSILQGQSIFGCLSNALVSLFERA